MKKDYVIHNMFPRRLTGDIISGDKNLDHIKNRYVPKRIRKFTLSERAFCKNYYNVIKFNLIFGLIFR